MQQGRPLGVLDPIDDAGHIADAQGAGARARDGGLADFLQRLELPDDAQRQVQGPLTHPPAGEGDVGALQRLSDLVHREVVDAQLLRIGLDADLPVQTTDDLGLRDALDLFQRGLDHLGGELGHLPQRLLALQDHDAHRTGRGIPAQDERTLGVFGIVVAEGNPVERFAQVQGGELHVRAPLVLDRDRGEPLP